MKTALIVLGYILSLWFIAAGALGTLTTGQRPPAFEIVFMLLGFGFIVWHSNYTPKNK